MAINDMDFWAAPQNQGWGPGQNLADLGWGAFGNAVGGQIGALNSFGGLGAQIGQQFAQANLANQLATMQRNALNQPLIQERMQQEGLNYRQGTPAERIEPLSGLFESILGGFGLGGGGGGAGGGVAGFTGPGGMSVGGNYDTGISEGPDLSADRARGADLYSGVSGSRAPTVSGQSTGGTSGHLRNLLSQGADRLGTDFDRTVSSEEATRKLASQIARSQAGLQGGGLYARLRQIPLRDRVAGRNAALHLAGSTAGAI